MKYAYVRVSTRDQNINRQITAIEKENIPFNQIYMTVFMQQI